MSPISLCREAEREGSVKHDASNTEGGSAKDWEAMNVRSVKRAEAILRSTQMKVDVDRKMKGLPIAEYVF